MKSNVCQAGIAPRVRPGTPAASPGGVPHPVRRLEKRFTQPGAQRLIDPGLAHGLVFPEKAMPTLTCLCELDPQSMLDSYGGCLARHGSRIESRRQYRWSGMTLSVASDDQNGARGITERLRAIAPCAKFPPPAWSAPNAGPTSPLPAPARRRSGCPAAAPSRSRSS